MTLSKVMGIINLSESTELIKELTLNRSIGAIPFAGRYRVIDFALSNMVNSDINNISIFTQGKTRSLMDHLGSGKPWDLDRKRDGLFASTNKDGKPFVDYIKDRGVYNDAPHQEIMRVWAEKYPGRYTNNGKPII